jgi:predicted phosphodiesterase
MRVAILSDVHGNVRALESVLADVRSRGPFDATVNAGDLAFGGPRPREALEMLRSVGWPTIVGNTDQWLAGDIPGVEAPPALAGVREWVRRRLRADDLDYLRALPMAHRIEPAGGPCLVVVHATPLSTTDSVDPDAPAATLSTMLEQGRTRYLAYGHIHRPYVRDVAGGMVVNVGSVGLPFDGIAQPAWAACTLAGGRWHAEIVRVAYDGDAVARELAASDHPLGELFARRVRTARMD